MKTFIIVVSCLLMGTLAFAQGQSVTVQLTAQEVALIQASIKTARGAKPISVQEWVNLRVKSSINAARGRGMNPSQCASLTDASRKELIAKGLCK